MSKHNFFIICRIPQCLVMSLIEMLRPRLAGVRRSKIPPELQVLTTLRFFAQGSYQQGLAQEHLNPSSQPSVCRILHRVASAICALDHLFIRFPQTKEERIAVKNG